ncbi:abortive infection family protein [Sphingopyxis fribergensis]
MQDLATNPARYVTTVEELLLAERMTQARDILRKAELRVETDGLGGWSGSNSTWTLYLSVEPADYVLLGEGRIFIEEQIAERFRITLGPYSADNYGVEIVPRLAKPDAAPTPNLRIRRQARQNIVDGLLIDKVSWAGKLEEIDFLGRIFDLAALPSTDSRYTDAAGDIYQHRVNNFDWEDDWVYNDNRFALMTGADETFLRFLCEMVHPVARPDAEEAARLASQFNDQLRQEGWELVEAERIAGRPRFEARRVNAGGRRAVSRANAVADALDAEWMQKEIERLEAAVDNDPSLAIGTAKDLVETCCKSILTRQQVSFPRSASLPDLVKLVAKELRLVPEGISDEAKGAETIRLLLRNLTAVTQYLAELRGLYGSGHGRDGRHRGLEPRHARLAVGAAIAFADFISETYHQRILPQSK